MKPLKYILLISGLWLLFTYSCRIEEDITTDPSAKLEFSVDTLYFDTVFTKLDSTGLKPISVTKQIRIFNPNKNAVKTNIRLSGKFTNVYRLNIDGESANQKFGKQILGKDSIIIFVQCYIDQSNPSQNLPFIVADQLIFETNGNVQDIDLVAWGQDANYFNNSILSCQNNNLRWTSEKPYVIYDSLLIPKGCTLTIDAGTKIHSYNKSCILVAGTLVVNGTPENPVIFEGTRIDGEYKELTNQWIGIRLLPGSKDNVINSAIIRNGFVGLEVDSQPVSANPNLRLNQTRIYNMAAVGLVGYSSKIVAVNNEITSCGQFGFFGALGGDYTLYHNTIASYNVNFNRQNPLVVLDNSPYTDKDNQIIAKYPLRFELVNNIIYGSLEEEFLVNINANGIAPTNTIIQTNLFRTKQGALNTNGNILNQNPEFNNTADNNYQLKANSPVKTKGTNIGVNTDLRNNPRGAAPSLGCWE